MSYLVQLQKEKSDAEASTGLTHEKSTSVEETIRKSLGETVHGQVPDVAPQELLHHSEKPEKVMGGVKEAGFGLTGEGKESDAETSTGLAYEKSTSVEKTVRKSQTPVGETVHGQVPDVAAQELLHHSEKPEQVMGGVKEPGLLMSSLSPPFIST